MTKVNELISALNEMESVKRLKELEVNIDTNPKVKEMIDLLLEYQQQMINAKHLNLVNAYADYKQRYQQLYQEILDIPFMEEYLDLLDENHLMLKNIFGIIEDEINNEILK